MLGWPLLWSLRQAMGETVIAIPFGGCTSMLANQPTSEGLGGLGNAIPESSILGP